MRKIMSIILAVCLATSLFASNAMALESEFVTAHEYNIALQNEYAKYGMELTSVAKDESALISRDVLAVELERVRDNADTCIVITDIRLVSLTPAAGSSGLRAMLVDGHYALDWYAKTPDGVAGYADYTAHVYFTVDIQNDYVSQIKDAYVEQDGYSRNLESWDVGVTATPNSPKTGQIRVMVDGDAVFAWTDPAGSTHRLKVPVTYATTIIASDYIN